MQKIMFIVLLVVYIHTKSYAQTSQIFNKVYTADSINAILVAVEPLQDGGYIAIGDFNWVNHYTALYMRKIDNFGVTQQVTILMDTVGYATILLHNSLIRTHDGNFLISGTIGSEEFVRDIVLIKFDEQGNILWRKIYPQSSYIEGYPQLITARDGGYLLYSFAGVDNGTAQFYLVKLNELGEVAWERLYGEDTEAIPFHAEQTTDGGYIVSGYNYHNDTGYDMYAIKTDSLGNVQWEQNYGTDGDDCACYVMETAPNQYALLGCVNKLTEFQPLWYTETQLMFARLDSSGNLINSTKRYYYSQRNNGCSVAYYDKAKECIIAATYSVSPNPTQPYLDKFSLSGERLLHVPLSTGIGMEDYLRDVEPTPDGGYVLAGFNFKTPSKGWVVKVDSLGNSCGVADCDNYEVVGVSETPLNDHTWSLSEAEVQVLPNPAQDYLVVENHSLEQSATFVLYDLLGRRVLEQKLATTKNTISTQNLPSGVYLYHILNPKNQILIYGKVSIVR